jgi:TonB-linked SusC/RagA family outer membrane protein
MNQQRWWYAAFGLAAALLAGWLAPAALEAQNTGTIQGQVLNAQNNQPLAAVQVSVVGTQRGSISDRDGNFTIREVPAGSYEVRAQFIGFGTQTQSVTVTAGQTTRVDFTMRYAVVDVGEIVVTGVAGEMQRAKLPFTVDQLRGDDLPVSRLNVASAIQGKVAGAQVVSASGRPGSAPSILLRGATSINAAGRNQDPLYIVDGVILSASVVDIDALDIETIEVVKGAAAASLYGSRAAAGVVQITTQRGRQFADGQVRYQVRSNYGVSDLPGSFPILQRHYYEMTPDGQFFIDGDGTPCTFRGTPSWNPNNECGPNMRFAGQTANGGSRSVWNTYAMNEWPDGTFDQVGRFFDGGLHQEHYVSAGGRQGATNFFVSFSRLDDEGPMLGRQGFQRNSFRLNLDQAVSPNFQVSASAYYSQSDQDTSEGTIFDLTRMQPGVDLTSCEPVRQPDGSLVRQSGSCLDRPEQILLNVNPLNLESGNPLYFLLAAERTQSRGRFLGSTDVRWTPRSWVDVEADFSYDRLDTDARSVNPKGWRTLTPSTANEGSMSISNNLIESVNAGINALFRWQVTDGITNRTRLRYAYEVQDNQANAVSGSQFGVRDVPTIGNTNVDTRSGSSSASRIVADGYFLISSFDIQDRYIVDALIRNDGSSLFGADERRHWYYRVGGAWRVGMEDWFNVDAIDEFKLRYSRGTAGGRPAFTAQYETFTISGGVPVPVNLGNRNLRPEHSTETEVGLEMNFLDRFALNLTYANTVTEDQILTVPLPAFTGFTAQVQNVGTLESKTYEASFDALLVRTPDFLWSARLLFDQTTSTITELFRPDFRYGVGGQNLGNVFLARVGEQLGTFYGARAARSCADLPEGTSCDGFTVNDDGYLVWVGSGGLSANQWGTSSTTLVRGAAVPWGTPFLGECTDEGTGERTTVCSVGDTSPDYTIGVSSTMDWRGFSVYGLINAVRGFDVYNQPLQWALFRSNIDIMNQAGVPLDQAKPIGYYQALYGGLGGLQPSDVFVEDASFVKLQELSLRYRMSQDQLERVPGLSTLSNLGLSVSGRNLFTWTDYRGYDPEVGAPGGDTGSAALARVDGFRYPNFRTWTFGVEITF